MSNDNGHWLLRLTFASPETETLWHAMGNDERADLITALSVNVEGALVKLQHADGLIYRWARIHHVVGVFPPRTRKK